MQGGLGILLGGQRLEQFLEDHWERSPLLAKGAAADLAGDLLTLDQFEGLLAACRPNDASSLSVVTGRVARPVTDGSGTAGRLPAVLQAYAAGATLLLTQVQRRRRPVAELCRAIEIDLLGAGLALVEAVSANAYLTPADAQGFDVHHDDHDAIVVQLHGQKRWEVFPPVDEVPVERCEAPIERSGLGPPVVDAELVPGDVLYVPRGFAHVAGTGTHSSLHVTLSLRTLTWLDLLTEAARADAGFRRSVPPTSAGPAGEVFGRDLLPRLARLDPEQVRRRRVAASVSSLEPLAGGRLAAIDGAGSIDAGTVVARTALTPCRAAVEDGQAVLRFPGATLRLPEAMAPVFDFVAGTASFTVGDLPPIVGTYDRNDLARVLVQRGLVEIRPEPPAEPVLRRSCPGRGLRDLTLLRGDSPPAVRQLGWLQCVERLGDDDCDEIIAACSEFPLTEPTTVGQAELPDHRQCDSRKVGLTDRTAWIFDLLCDVAAEATRSSFGIALTGISRAPQYVEYRPGRGEFRRHNDYSHDQADSPRKVTVVLQLSSPDDYDGGDFQTFGVDVEHLPRDRGAVLVLPSFVYHAVTPVTRGVRRALVAWIAGPRLC